jgi:cobalamin biosynthesis Mg chelatase CobN
LDEAWEDDDEDREGDAAAQTSDSEAELEVLPPAKAPQVVVARAKQFDEAAERLDAGWGIDDDGEDDDANAKEAGPALRPEPVRASASRLVASKRDAEPGTGSLTKAAGAKAKPGGEAKDSLADQVRRSRRARVPFKKAHRALSRKNDERSRRRKRTNKAERKAQRREQAKQARAARELQAKAEQKRTQKSRADAGENRSKSSVSVTKRAPERKPAAQAVKRRQTAKQGEPGRLQPDAVAGTARPRKKRNKAREQQRTRQRRQKASMLIAALVLALAALAWFVAGR